MSPYSLTASASVGRVQGRGPSFRAVLCLAILLGLSASFTSAQTTISPTTSTVQLSGTPGASITQPDGAIVTYGTAISPVTNQPVRHLWVADSAAGICRVDPDLDSPGPYSINPRELPFFRNEGDRWDHGF